MRKPKENGVLSFVLEAGDLYFTKRVSRSAAELAYFLILSFFPVLICVNAVIGALHLDPAMVLSGLASILPADAASLLTDYLGYLSTNETTALLVAGVFMLLLSASAAMRSLMNIMDDLFERKAYAGLWQVVASVAYSVLFLLTIYLSLVVVLTGNWFFHLLERVFHVDTALLPWAWQWLRFVILFCFVLAFVLLVYRLSAPRGKCHAPLFRGALIASAALVAASVLFSYFISMSSRYSLIYGSLASVIVLLVWLYLCGNIVILGNVLNCVWYRRAKRRGM